MVVEHFGGYKEDLGRSDKQLSLYENAERIWAEGSERVAEAVAKVRNALFPFVIRLRFGCASSTSLDIDAAITAT